MDFFKPKFWDQDKISFFSIIFLPISWILKLLIFTKKSFIKSHQFPIPIICIGNIYLGGTGKTPMSIEVFSILKNLNMKPVFIRKKYKAFEDEVNIQKQKGPIYENKKRIIALKEAIQNKSNVAILDDGFQDFSIKKNLSIVCFNEKQWIGNGMTIPSGPLRENLSALKRSNCVVINGEKNSHIENKILSKNKELKIFYTSYKPENIEEFKNKKVTAFAGIGNPENFFDLLRNYKINIVETIKFPDHHEYLKKELEDILKKIRHNDSILLTTEKDYFRIPENYKKNIKCLKIKVEIENKNQFIDEIKKII